MYTMYTFEKQTNKSVMKKAFKEGEIINYKFINEKTLRKAVIIKLEKFYLTVRIIETGEIWPIEKTRAITIN